MENSRKRMGKKHDAGECGNKMGKKRVWSPVVIGEKGPQMIPLVRSAKKNMKALLLTSKEEIEETMRIKYDGLLEQIDSEIEETKRQLESFLKVNDAIYEKSTKRLKRMTDAVNNEMELVRNIHGEVVKEAAHGHDKVKQKAIRDFKQEALKILQSKS
ncbi:Aste57867_9458 [Aphanomyces stellatus]|uniref:Aste57867_9458 protein n=1 Tax=Aphanomyces stellatus TaxID=120398 RepID=A0A485KMU4_9STRA|nr:hypothetical protein As57867_009422 [Aphanomyces stellatus]VFT86337.1 Aste57867_9458 [Aphanomyces stellatus]